MTQNLLRPDPEFFTQTQNLDLEKSQKLKIKKIVSPGLVEHFKQSSFKVRDVSNMEMLVLLSGKAPRVLSAGRDIGWFFAAIARDVPSLPCP